MLIVQSVYDFSLLKDTEVSHNVTSIQWMDQFNGYWMCKTCWVWVCLPPGHMTSDSIWLQTTMWHYPMTLVGVCKNFRFCFSPNLLVCSRHSLNYMVTWQLSGQAKEGKEQMASANIALYLCVRQDCGLIAISLVLHLLAVRRWFYSSVIISLWPLFPICCFFALVFKTKQFT